MYVDVQGQEKVGARHATHIVCPLGGLGTTFLAWATTDHVSGHNMPGLGNHRPCNSYISKQKEALDPFSGSAPDIYVLEALYCWTYIPGKNNATAGYPEHKVPLYSINYQLVQCQVGGCSPVKQNYKSHKKENRKYVRRCYVYHFSTSSIQVFPTLSLPTDFCSFAARFAS